MRTTRQQSESGIYHVVSRGVGQQIIFESDADRRRYLDSLKTLVDEAGGTLLAWCLMSNHVHILVKMDIEALSNTMRKLNSSYALYFNLVHGRSGHLFQGRFASEPIDTDEYLMTVVRYIHRNPVKAHMTPGCCFKWSSYDAYASGNVPKGAEIVMALFGSVDSFVRFHESGDGERCLDIASKRKTFDDEEALEIAIDLFGDAGLFALKALPKADRDAALAKLKHHGLTTRQIQRLTGVSLGVISKA